MEEKLETKICELIEFCGDFHLYEIEFCLGLKNCKECPLYIAIKNQDVSGIYGRRI